MRLALPVFFVPLVLTYPALAQNDGHLEPLPALPSTPEPAAPPAPQPSSAASPAATDGHADAPATAMAPASPCPCTQYRHRGFYLGVNSGFGYLSTWGDGPTGPVSLSGESFSARIAIGGTIANGLALAGDLRASGTNGTFHGGPIFNVTSMQSSNGSSTTNSHTVTTGSVTVVEIGGLLDWYPDPAGPWHVGASLGLGGEVVTDGAGNQMQSTSLRGSAFGGYEWWLGPAWSLGLVGVVSGGPKATLTDSNQNDTAYRMMPLSIGIETLLLYY